MFAVGCGNERGRNRSGSAGDYKLNEIILSQFQSHLYGYLLRKIWMDVLSYGDHWTSRTGEWEGYRRRVNEKDVTVEDIDWFATLIS